MRRMRDVPWHYLLFLIPVAAVALGIQYFIKKWNLEPGKRDSTALMKPSQMLARPQAAAPAEKKSEPKTIAQAPAEPARSKLVPEHEAAEMHAKAQAEPEKAPEPAPMPQSLDVPSRPSHLAKADLTASGTACAAIEFPGVGIAATRTTKDDWARVMTQFHAAKGDLLAWLQKNRRDLSERTAALMDSQIRNLRIQRPPATEEPDLAWRGIGVWTQDASGAPLLRIGSGFIKLVTQEPKRARFEMTRLVAQAWAPCELARVDAGAPWNPLLKCLSVEDANACANGTYSEAGWAVSTALARALVAPGCDVQAFAEPAAMECVKRIPLPLSIAMYGGER